MLHAAVEFYLCCTVLPVPRIVSVLNQVRVGVVMCVIVCDDDHRGYRTGRLLYQVLPVHDFTICVYIGKDPSQV